MDALRYVANLTKGNSMSHILKIFLRLIYFLTGVDYTDKAYYLGYCVNKILCVKHGLDKPTDRDSFMYKRVDLSGFLLGNLFREAYKQFQRDSKIALDTEYRFNGSIPRQQIYRYGRVKIHFVKCLVVKSLRK